MFRCPWRAARWRARRCHSSSAETRSGRAVTIARTDGRSPRRAAPWRFCAARSGHATRNDHNMGERNTGWGTLPRPRVPAYGLPRPTPARSVHRDPVASRWIGGERAAVFPSLRSFVLRNPRYATPPFARGVPRVSSLAVRFGSGSGLVSGLVFKTSGGRHKAVPVGSIPMHSRHFSPRVRLASRHRLVSLSRPVVNRDPCLSS
jgi:hypothetical protein